MTKKTSLNRKKLLGSKWTARRPQNKEKHFIVSKIKKNELDEQIVDSLILEAVYSGKCYELTASELEDEGTWLVGWQ